MPNEHLVEFNMLDVGSGIISRGDVNIGIFRDRVSARKANNFVIADVMHLPFKDESFNVAFSAFTIEQVKAPFVMLKEMCRVAKRKVIVRYFHRWSSGAGSPDHIYRFGESWFQNAAKNLDLESVQFANSIDYPIGGRLLKICPRISQQNFPWQTLRHFERWFRRIIRVPLEMEVWIKKIRHRSDSNNIRFVVVYNRPEIFKNCCPFAWRLSLPGPPG